MKNHKRTVKSMKKRIAALLVLAALAALLGGCGMMVVEDSKPVYIGENIPDRTLTERF